MKYVTTYFGYMDPDLIYVTYKKDMVSGYVIYTVHANQ